MLSVILFMELQPPLSCSLFAVVRCVGIYRCQVTYNLGDIQVDMHVALFDSLSSSHRLDLQSSLTMLPTTAAAVTSVQKVCFDPSRPLSDANNAST